MNINIPALDFRDPHTFLGKKLTPEEGQKRMEILCEEQDTLEAGELSPRRNNELHKLIEIYFDDCCIRFSEEIVRDSSESYTIVFNKDPSAVLADELENSDKIFKAFPRQSGFGMLKAINDKTHMGWYRDAVLDRFGSSSNDFLDALRHILSDFKIIEFTKKNDSQAFPFCKQMEDEIMTVMDKQISFFNSCERAALEIAELTHKILIDLYDLSSESKKGKTVSETASGKINRIFPMLGQHTKDTILKIEPLLKELINHSPLQISDTPMSLLLSSSLASSTKIIQSSANSFAEHFKKEFIDLTCDVKNLSDLSDCLVALRYQLISVHALWLQSRKQWGTMLSASAINNQKDHNIQHGEIEFPSFSNLLKLEESLNEEHFYYTKIKRSELRKNEFLNVAWVWITNNTHNFKLASKVEHARKILQKGMVYIQCKDLKPTKIIDCLFSDNYFKCKEEFPTSDHLCTDNDSICHKIHIRDLIVNSPKISLEVSKEKLSVDTWEILPNLFLGKEEANVKYYLVILEENGNKDEVSFKSKWSHSIETNKLGTVMKLIDTNLKKGMVLVQDSSAAVLVAYLMRMCGVTAEEVANFLKSKYPITSVDKLVEEAKQLHKRI